jgi:hypothetical protein
MTVRTRSRADTRLDIGSYWTLSGNVTTPHSVTHGTTETCEDVTGNFDGINPLRLVQRHTYIPVINGETRSGGVVTRRYTNCPLGSGSKISPPVVANYFGTPSGLQKGALAVKILAETNPSAPASSLPTMLGELFEFRSLFRIPALVQAWGSSLLRKVALGHITWRWAIKPMINEIGKLFDWTVISNERFREIVNMSTGKRIRKRVLLGKTTNVVVTDNTYTRHSENFVVRFRQTRTTSISEWGSARWGAANDTVIPVGLGKDEIAHMRRLTQDVLNGITSYELLATAWELCPWSWFVDWFVDVGNTIAAYNNTLGLTWSDICYMRTCIARYDYDNMTGWPSSGYTLSGIPFEIETTKERFPVQPGLGVSPCFLPLFTQRQWSILGSLAALRLEIPPSTLKRGTKHIDLLKHLVRLG